MKDAPFSAIGVDIGGTKIAAGVVSFPDGIVRARGLIPTRADRPGEEVLADVERLVMELASERVDAIGLGICEIVDPSGNVASANCIQWEDKPVREKLSKVAPTVIEADVRAAAIAEALFGAGRGAGVFLYVTIGTGISSCLVIDGKPFKGSRGASGTMASGPLPKFNQSGPAFTLEQIASGPALIERFGSDAVTGKEVLAAAATGNEKAREVVRSAAEALGGAIGSLVNVLDPDLVILGGGLGLSEGLYRDSLIEAARRHIWWDRHRDLPIVSASTGPDAGIIGAAAAAWHSISAGNCAAAG